MIGEELGADMHVLSCDAAAARNLMLAVERCHLTVEALVATPYAAGLSTLADDEAELGAALIDMGAGTTSVSVFSGGNLTYVDGFALGGNHVTIDIARGLSIRLADAERLKTLYGACIASASDERGDDLRRSGRRERSGASAEGQLISIIKPRVEEILELVRDRLKSAGFPAHAGRRLVLTGGASQLTGMPEEAKRIISGQVRIGPSARHRGAAGIGEKPGLLRGGRTSRLSAGERQRTFQTLAPRQRAGAGDEWIYGPRRPMVERAAFDAIQTKSDM